MNNSNSFLGTVSSFVNATIKKIITWDFYFNRQITLSQFKVFSILCVIIKTVEFRNLKIYFELDLLDMSFCARWFLFIHSKQG